MKGVVAENSSWLSWGASSAKMFSVREVPTFGQLGPTGFAAQGSEDRTGMPSCRRF